MKTLSGWRYLIGVAGILILCCGCQQETPKPPQSGKVLSRILNKFTAVRKSGCTYTVSIPDTPFVRTWLVEKGSVASRSISDTPFVQAKTIPDTPFVRIWTMTLVTADCTKTLLCPDSIVFTLTPAFNSGVR